jgi:hypothetical protein
MMLTEREEAWRCLDGLRAQNALIHVSFKESHRYEKDWNRVCFACHNAHDLRRSARAKAKP